MKNQALIGCAIACLTPFVPASAAEKPNRSTGDLSGHWHLFVDDSIVLEKTAVTRRYHPFQKHPANPVLRADKPWEGNTVYLYGTVLPGEDGRGYRMWYHGFYGGEYTNLYATSVDGLTWEKPNLGVRSIDGSPGTNLLFRRTPQDHMPQVIANPDAEDAERRYLFFNYDYGRTKPDNLISGYYLAYSPDGIRWTDAPRNPVMMDVGDVGNVTWDARQKKFLNYTKVFAPVDGYRRRAVGYSATRDPETWMPAELILVPDKFDDRWVTMDMQHTDFYGLSGFAYESGYIGFLWIFRIVDGNNDGPLLVELVSSRDGINWVRQEGDRPLLLDVGADGEWDDGMVVTPNHPLVEGDTIKLFYGGFGGTHGEKGVPAAIGLATLRKDGFASLDAATEQGTVTTRVLEGASGELRVNAAIRGELRAEVLDNANRVIPGYSLAESIPLAGDGIGLAMKWQQNVKLPQARGGIRIRFALRDASLFSFHAGDRARWSSEPVRKDALLSFDDTTWESVVRLHGTVAHREEGGSSGGALSFQKAGDLVEIADTQRLGTNFTLALRLKTTKGTRLRLFSAYRGSGDIASGELLFDAEPRTGILRFAVNGQKVQSKPHFAADREFHHYAVTYANGDVTLYLDGKKVGLGSIRQGSAHLYHAPTIVEHFGEPGVRSDVGVHLVHNLRIGEDIPGRFVITKDIFQNDLVEQLTGLVDDVLVSRRAFSPAEIAALALGRAAAAEAKR